LHLPFVTRAALAALAALALSGPAAAADPPAPTPAGEVAALVAQEKLRADVEAILADLESGAGDEHEIENTSDRFLLLGPGVVPFLLSELERQELSTFAIAAYTLGHLEGEGIVEALRRAAERLLPEEDDKAKRAMRAWAVYGLALQRAPDVVDAMLAGKDPVGRLPWMENMRLLEMATTLGGREAVLQLIPRVDGFRQDPDREIDVIMAAEALGVSKQPEVPAKLLTLLADKSSAVRIAALEGLGQAGDPSVFDRILPHLDAASVMERQAAADALVLLRAAGRERVLLAKLETEKDAGVRSALYLALADAMGDAFLEALLNHWGRPDGLDRVGAIRAADRLRSPKAANILRAGLKDADARVVTAAMEGLSHLPGRGPTDTLLALLRDPREPVSRDAVRLLAIRREPKAGPRVADLILRELGRSSLSVGDRRDRFRVLGEALVDLQFTDAVDDLRRGAQAEQDPELQGYLFGLVRRLELLRGNGEDRAKWAATLKSDDAGVRQLARVRLGALGGAEAARALAAAFGRDIGEDRELLGELGRTGSPEAAPLLERVLMEPAFDPRMLRPLREGAAYGARLLGGPRMTEALRRSLERREGRDPVVAVYYALVAGKDALPLLRDTRITCLRWHEWYRGRDLDRIDSMIRRLSVGQSIVALDVPPEYLAP
jgi:HEAT repeat protein